MTTVVSIVEGDGEVAALPVLLRRLCQWLSPEMFIDVQNPIRVRRDRFLNRDAEFSRFLKLAAEKCGHAGWIMVLLDADDDCPMELAKNILDRAQAIVPHRRVSVILANREYEAWFVAAAASLDGRRGFALAGEEIPEAESIRDAKGWLGRHIPNGTYKEVTDQPAFSALMDLQHVMKNSRSFRKLCSEWSKNMHAVLKQDEAL